MKFSILPSLLLIFVAIGSAQTPDTQAGAILFRDNCARCHGANLEGGKKVPALADLHTKKRWTEERITKQILNGEGKMPAFAGSFSAEQVRQLVAYLRAADHPAPPTGPEQK